MLTGKTKLKLFTVSQVKPVKLSVPCYVEHKIGQRTVLICLPTAIVSLCYAGRAILLRALTKNNHRQG